MKNTAIIAGLVIGMTASLGSSPALAYDGTNCRAPGNCWEPKPGYPEKVEGSEYDPQHDPMELNKQAESIQAMEERNAMRVKHFQETGEFVFDVSTIESGMAGEAALEKNDTPARDAAESDQSQSAD